MLRRTNLFYLVCPLSALGQTVVLLNLPKNTSVSSCPKIKAINVKLYDAKNIVDNIESIQENEEQNVCINQRSLFRTRLDIIAGTIWLCVIISSCVITFASVCYIGYHVAILYVMNK